jgi:outer membrane protein OmpA-like peptidoglycan-associated protein
MADSVLTRLTSIVKPSTMAQIATQLGVPEQYVSRGLALSSASVFSAMANKAGDPDAMRQIVDTASRTPADAIASGVSAGQLADSTSPLMATARGALSSLFGGSTNWIVNLIAGETGMGGGAAATMLALGAHSVLNFIGARVRDDGMTAGSLAGFLNREAPAIRSQLPASFDAAFTKYFGGASTRARTAEREPVVPAAPKRSYLPWVAMAAILAAALWYGLRPTRMIEPVSAPTIGTSGTISAPDLGRFVPLTLVDGTAIIVPERGVENRLLAFITSSRAPDTITWFDFDRLLFDTGSATLQPQSNEQLRAVAAILKAHPNAHVKIGGYTDNVGSPADNLKLSQERADNVRTQLVDLGVDADRVTAEGYGEAHPVADNSTDAGRAMNRRISMLVTQK